GTVSCAGGVGAERIAHDDTDEISNQLLERSGALVIADSMNHDAGRGQAPHLPRLGVAIAKAFPPGLIEADHWLGDYSLEQRLIQGRQAFRDRPELIPERLRCDRKTVAPQDANLASQRNVVEVLIDGD